MKLREAHTRGNRDQLLGQNAEKLRKVRKLCVRFASVYLIGNLGLSRFSDHVEVETLSYEERRVREDLETVYFKTWSCGRQQKKKKKTEQTP